MDEGHPSRARWTIHRSLSHGECGALLFIVGHVYPELVDDDEAQKEIRNLRFTGP